MGGFISTLRTVPPFVTAHKFCLKFLQEFDHYVCAVHDYVGKVDLCKGYWNPKRKLGVTTHFSEIIELLERNCHTFFVF